MILSTSLYLVQNSLTIKGYDLSYELIKYAVLWMTRVTWSYCGDLIGGGGPTNLSTGIGDGQGVAAARAEGHGGNSNRGIVVAVFGALLAVDLPVQVRHLGQVTLQVGVAHVGEDRHVLAGKMGQRCSLESQ